MKNYGKLHCWIELTDEMHQTKDGLQANSILARNKLSA